MNHAPDNAAERGRRPTILLVGDAAGALTSDTVSAWNRFEYCRSVPDAMALAAETYFSSIYVVMSGFKGRLESALTTLRRISPTSRIILLARMHEEAAARQMIRTAANVTGPADTYHLCPVDPAVVADGGRTPTSCSMPCQDAASLLAARDERIRQLERLAMEDDLTGLMNRRYIREFLQQILVKARCEMFNVTLLVFDIDNFKRYNDTYGHTLGDNVLRETAIMMRRCCRTHDVTGRIGGDEFAFIFWDRRLPGEHSDDQAVEAERRHAEAQHPREAVFMAERFRSVVSSAELSFLGPEGKGTLTISGGLASYPKDGATVDSLFEQADKALLGAKRSGKNQIYLVGSNQPLNQ